MLGEAVKTDPRVRRTRQLLQHALEELVQEKSLDSITVQDIAALLNAMVRDHFQAKLDVKLPGEPALTTDNLRLLILTTCEYLGEFINHCSPVPRFGEHAIMFIAVQNHIYETLLLWIRASGGRAPEAIALTTSWAIWGTVFQWARNGRKIPAANLNDQIMTLLQGGLRDYLQDGRHEARA
jgi:hypothetical protein